MSLPDFPIIELRMDPQYRRCGVYAILGFLIAIVILYTIDRLPWILGSFVLGIPSIALFGFTHRYRIRIDDRGIWRRRFIRWDRWPWEAFDSCLIRCSTMDDKLTYPGKSWYWRTIATSFLAAADREKFESAVARFRMPRAPLELPNFLVVKYGFRQWFEVSDHGIRKTTSRGKARRLIAWSEVEKGEVYRLSHARPRFIKLELQLQGEPKPMQLIRDYLHGEDAELLAEFVQRQLGHARFDTTALHGKPADIAEANRRLARLEKIIGELTKAVPVVAAILAVMLLIVDSMVFWKNPNPESWLFDKWIGFGLLIVLSILSFMLPFISIPFAKRRTLELRSELLAWISEHTPKQTQESQAISTE